MSYSRLGSIFIPGFLMASASLAQPALALAADESTSGGTTAALPATYGQLQEITVTAQRTESSLSKTPVTVVVMTQEDLQKQNVATEQDLQAAVPGLLVRNGQNSNQINFAIRGQSIDAYSNARPSVQPYFDEVQIPYSGQSSELYDLQSVQVLEGPQGTLFGRNSTGGAVLYTSAKPNDELGGYASVGGGSYGNERVEGAINLPLIPETLRVRLAGFQETRDGFQHNLFNNQDLGNESRYGLRSTIELQTNRLTNNLVADFEDAIGTSVTGVVSSLDTNIPGSFPTVALYNPATSDAVLAQVLQGEGVPAAAASALATGNWANYVAAHPGVDPLGLANAAAVQQAKGPYTVDVNAQDGFHSRNLILSNITSFDLTDSARLRNIIGYNRSTPYSNAEADGTAYAISDTGYPPYGGVFNSITAFSEEPQIQGTRGPLKYVAGGYYADESNHWRQGSEFLDVIPTGLLEGVPGLWGEQFQNITTSYSTTYAGYAQGTYDLQSITGVRGLAFTLGTRFTDEKVRETHDPGDRFYDLATTGLLGPTGNVILPASDFSNDQSRVYRNVSWTTGIEDQITPHLLVYLDARRGYKDGGYNPQVQPRIGTAALSIVAGSAYRTEELTDAELGSKYTGELLGRPTAVDVAAFNDWITDSQRTAYVDVAGSPDAVTVNVPRARVSGIELDSSISALTWLRLGAIVNYTDARFTNNVVTIAGVPQVFGTYPDTPKWSGDVHAELIAPLVSGVHGLLRVDEFGTTSEFYSSTANLNPAAVVPGYGLLNFTLGVSGDNQRWSFTVTLKNALNKVYYVGGLPLAQLVQINTMVPGLPRMAFAQLRYNFNN